MWIKSHVTCSVLSTTQRYVPDNPGNITDWVDDGLNRPGDPKNNDRGDRSSDEDLYGPSTQEVEAGIPPATTSRDEFKTRLNMMYELIDQMDKEWREERDTIDAFRRDGEAAIERADALRNEGETAIARAQAARERIEVMRSSQVSLRNKILAEFRREGMVPSPDRENSVRGNTRRSDTLEDTQFERSPRPRANIDLPQYSPSRAGESSGIQDRDVLNTEFQRSINRDITTREYRGFRDMSDHGSRHSNPLENSDEIIRSARYELEQPRHNFESDLVYRR